MTQEKIKDLCSRLPYGVKIQVNNKIETLESVDIPNEVIGYDSFLTSDLKEIKPYLFPLSSMTEEQYESLKESGILSNCSHSHEYVNPHIHEVYFIFKGFKTYSLELIEWLNKHHFDYRGLISMGLAIDATGLNIYD